RAHVDAPPAEAPQVVESGVRADAHAFFLGAADDPAHRHGITGVEAAGDARGSNDLQDRVVVADRVGAEALAHVCVEIDHSCHGSTFHRWRAINSARTLWYCPDEHNISRRPGKCAERAFANTTLDARFCRRATPP